jgi:NagD protein
MLFDGAALIATNLDPNCPTVDGVRPGCGATVAFLEKATGKTAFSVGKPSPVMMRAARKELGLATSETVVIGDTMETDILGGVQMGYRTILVLSGGTKRKDLAKYPFRPDVVVDSVADLCGSSGPLEDLLPPSDPNEDTVRNLEQWKRRTG